jgi:hypothetical protein
MFKIKTVYVLVMFYVCTTSSAQHAKTKIEQTLNQWHNAASQAEYDTYISLMTEDAVFIGTDPTEYWQGQAFKDFAKPYFDKGKAWSFKTLKRNIYLSEDQKTGWFDELLDTQMGVCRGSGVVVYKDDHWKIKHYVLSISIPNDNVKEVKKLKQNFDDKLINDYRSND